MNVTQADIDAAKAARADMIIGGFQGDHGVWRKVEERFANHRTDASKELLEALEELMVAVATTAMSEASCERLLPHAMKARAAIAKAKGEDGEASNG